MLENLMKAMQAKQGGAPMMGDPDGMEETDEENEGNVDPRASSPDGGTLFIDKALFPDNCKVGDTVTIRATVTKHGAKYGVVPEEITSAKSGGGMEGGSEGQDDF